MSKPIIQVENLSKQYRIGAREAAYGTFRESLASAAKAPFKRFTRNGKTDEDTIWALKDVSFEVQPGEVVGIIGRNGAGKSTLLKILSRITEPTTGRAKLYGRIASLLEVGTGFHPELTGRENIYLNGTILGMTRREIERKFDEIVTFAEVEKFIDTPVKRYSSGMYLRLAFAVAAYLDPEILVVDEVLAVGDAAFQRKCLGKMRDVAKEGRTVLFVSHNMNAVRTLCNRALLLDCGKSCFDGAVDTVIHFYDRKHISNYNVSWSRSNEKSSGSMDFGEIESVLVGQQPQLKLVCKVMIRCHQVCASAFIAVDICDNSLTPIMQAIPQTNPFIPGVPGTHWIELQIELPGLIPGTYTTDYWIGSHYSSTMDYLRQVTTFEVTRSPLEDRTHPHSSDHGFMVPSSNCKLV